MKIIRKHWYGNEQHELSSFVEDRLAHKPYSDSEGVIEDLKSQHARMQKYVGKLTELLVEKGVVTIDEVGALLDEDLCRG